MGPASILAAARFLNPTLRQPTAFFAEYSKVGEPFDRPKSSNIYVRSSATYHGRLSVSCVKMTRHELYTSRKFAFAPRRLLRWTRHCNLREVPYIRLTPCAFGGQSGPPCSVLSSKELEGSVVAGSSSEADRTMHRENF
jgi:hypothetical protein